MTSTEKVQSIVLCEGFEDRAFWRGWLLHLGCIDPTQGGKVKTKDVHGNIIVGKGRFLFKTSKGSDVIVQPFHGKDNARRAVEDYLKRLQRPAQIVLNLDSDLPTSDADVSAIDDKIYGIAQDHGWSGGRAGPFALNGTVLTGIAWQCDDPFETVGIPEKQTLERLVTSAIRASNPEMGATVESFLRSAPEGLTLPKSYSRPRRSAFL